MFTLTQKHALAHANERKCWQILAENLIIKATLCHSVIIVCTMAMKLSIVKKRMRLNDMRVFAFQQIMSARAFLWMCVCVSVRAYECTTHTKHEKRTFHFGSAVQYKANRNQRTRKKATNSNNKQI